MRWAMDGRARSGRFDRNLGSIPVRGLRVKDDSPACAGDTEAADSSHAPP